jgi:predicted esterase
LDDLHPDVPHVSLIPRSATVKPVSTVHRLALVAALAMPAAAQEPPLPGRLIERDSVAGDSVQHVAAYFPAAYTKAHPAPVLFVLDPRGRAVLALRLFAGAAERHGWIVVSSYNSASDTQTDPNVDAMNAMLDWVQGHARIDTTRMYLAGFSGTARVAWALAAELRGRVAGMFGTGGGVSFSARGPEMTFGGDSTFAFFGSAGATDFNHSEMRGFAARLRTARIPSRFQWFQGGHSWPPRRLCEEAVDWLELRAMLGGRRPADSTYVARQLALDLHYADSLEQAGQWDAAEFRYREIALDVPGRPEGRMALTRADDLAKRDALATLRERIRALTENDLSDATREFSTLQAARASAAPLSPETLLERIGVASLQRRAASADSVERDAALRRLSNIAAWISFYEPRAFLAGGQPARAASSLRAAATLGPLRGESCELVRRAAEQLPRDEAQRLPPCG